MTEQITPEGIDSTPAAALERLLDSGDLDLSVSVEEEPDADIGVPPVGEGVDDDEPPETESAARTDREQPTAAPEQRQERQPSGLLSDRREIAEQANELQGAVQDLHFLLQNNQISQDQFNHAMGEAQTMHNGLLQADLHAQKRDMEQQQHANRASEALALDLGLNTVTERKNALEQGINYLRDKGLSDQEIQAIKDPGMIKMVYNEMKSAQGRTEQRAKQKLKASRKRSRQRAKAEQPAATNGLLNSEQQIDAIAGLLSGL